MLTVKEVANRLSIHVNTVRRWSDQGIIKAVVISERGDRRFPEAEIERYLNSLNPEERR